MVIRQPTSRSHQCRKALEGDPLHNVFVHAGDHIYVPPSLGTNVTVLGQVGAPQLFPFRAGLRLTQTLALAGGVNVGGDKGDIRVIRGPLDKPPVYQASLRDIVDGESHDVLMQQGDIVFVTDDPIEDIGEVMALISPVLSLGLSSAAFILSIEDNTSTAPRIDRRAGRGARPCLRHWPGGFAFRASACTCRRSGRSDRLQVALMSRSAFAVLPIARYVSISSPSSRSSLRALRAHR